MITVAAAQIDLEFGDLDANIRRCVEAIEAAARAGADLLVLTECALSGYIFSSREDAMKAAVDHEGPEVQLLLEVTKGVGIHVVVGFLERSDGHLYNASVLLGPDGRLGHYRKGHLPSVGVDRFVDVPPLSDAVVVDTDLGRIGLNICYDIRFPESARLLALSGAEIVAQPTNWPSQARILAEHVPIVRALENGVFFIVANRGDSENGVNFVGRSQIIDPGGIVLAIAERAPELLLAEIDPAQAREKHVVVDPGEYELDLWQDRRPELYGPLGEGS